MKKGAITLGGVSRFLKGNPQERTTPNEGAENTTSDSPQLRPSASQSTVYSAGPAIACLDRSPDGQRAVVAGSKVFKILSVDGPKITEELDLRSIITSYATTHDLSAAHPDQLNIKAVQWSHGDCDTTIVTASGNGKITVYDLNRATEGLEVARISDHTRQVHKLDVNPFRGNWLLSASQDGTVKLFDLRAPNAGRNGFTTRLQKVFKGFADAVRDVKWSPTDGMEFACCTDTGVVMKWDIRKVNSPLLKFSAHQTLCSSIAWHPDGDHLVSGGADQLCKVWDFSKKADRNQKPRYQFATPGPIANVSWRPACWSATAQGNRAAQVSIAYDDISATKLQMATMHIWDLARPSMPFKEIEEWDSSPSGHLWNTRDLLWSVDRHGRFTQTDVAFVPKVIERRPLSNFAFSPTGDVLMLLEERPIPRRRSRPSISSPEASPSFQHVSSAPQFSVSRSDSEEDVVGSFLGPRRPKGHRRRHSGRSTQSLSTTPPNVTTAMESRVMSLEDAVLVTGLYKPQQVMAIGRAPSTAKRQTYQYYTNRYLLRMSKDILTPEPALMSVRIASILEHFGRTAEKVGHYRLAQSWRILGYTLNLLLTRRAEYHRKTRLEILETPSKMASLKEDVEEADAKADFGDNTPRRATHHKTPRDSPRVRPIRSIISEDLESTSNVATPLVRPMRDSIIQETRAAMHTPINMVEDDILSLPAPVHAPSTSPGPIPVPGALQSDDNTPSSVDGYDFYGIDSFSPAKNFNASQRRPPLRFDYSSRATPVQRIQPQRHDSSESFQMFSTSGESHQTKFLSSSNSDNSQSLQDRVHSWEDSLNNNSRHRQSVDLDAPTQSEGSDENYITNSRASSIRARNGISFNPEFPPVFKIQEASVPSPGNDLINAPPMEKEPDTPSTQTPEKVSEDPNIIESDFLPWPKDPEFTITPINPAVLVQRIITFETQTGALNAAAMILLLKPLLPASAIDDIQARAIIRQYHHRLTSMSLFTEAALLRNLSVPHYPSVFGPAQESIYIGFFCTDCNKPLDPDPLIPHALWRCSRCQGIVDTCAICKQRDLDPTLYEKDSIVTEAGAVWFYCPGCGHGGHSACMRAWHADDGDTLSGGCCPLDGCLHPCLPGAWRERRREEKSERMRAETERKKASEVRERTVGINPRNVRRDQREVTQSRAVEGVRVALGVGPGLVRSKSVKLVAPGEEGG